MYHTEVVVACLAFDSREVDEVGRAAASVEASEGEQGGRHPSTHLALACVVAFVFDPPAIP